MNQTVHELNYEIINQSMNQTVHELNYEFTIT